MMMCNDPCEAVSCLTQEEVLLPNFCEDKVCYPKLTLYEH